MRPPERIALMRLLLCVAHAPLDPAGKDPRPRDEEDWRGCRAELPSRVETYLQKWQSTCALFGKDQRFLQVNKLVPLKAERDANWADKLDLALATGNNTTLFDNAGGSDRAFDDSQLALMLLAFQNFSPCGRIGVAKWSGSETAGNGSSSHAVCASGNALHAFIRHATLLDTVHFNLINYEAFLQHAGRSGTWGRPVWEQARRWIERLVELKSDRGKLAELRGWFRDASRPRAYPALMGLRGSLDDDAFNTVAGLFAHHPEHLESAGDLGAVLHRPARDHSTFEGRLRRILCCDEREVLDHLRPVILAAKRDGLPVDYLQLYLDLQSWGRDYWGDEVRKQWATSFWLTAELITP